MLFNWQTSTWLSEHLTNRFNTNFPRLKIRWHALKAWINCLGRVSRAVITLLALSLLYWVAVLVNLLLATISLSHTFSYDASDFERAFSTLFSAQASFLAVTFVIFVLLLERLAANDQLNSDMFRRFLRQSSAPMLPLAAVLSLFWTGLLSTWSLQQSSATDYTISLLGGSWLIFFAICVWLVIVSFKAINFATPGHVFEELKRFLKRRGREEVQREYEALVATGKMQELIMCWGPSPFYHGKDPVLATGLSRPVHVEAKSYDRVVADIDLNALISVRDELAGDACFPEIRAVLPYNYGDVIHGQPGSESTTVAYVDRDASDKVISQLERVYDLRPVEPLRLDELLSYIEQLGARAAERKENGILGTALDQLEELQESVLDFRFEKVKSLYRRINFPTTAFRLDSSFASTFEKIGKEVLRQEHSRSISQIARSWSNQMQAAFTRRDEKVLQLYCDVFGTWTEQASDVSTADQKAIIDVLAPEAVSFGHSIVEAVRSEINKIFSTQEKPTEQDFRDITEILHSAAFALPPFWYLFRSALATHNYDQILRIWLHVKGSLFTFSKLMINIIRSEISNLEIATQDGDGTTHQERLRLLRRLDALLSQLHEQQRTFMLAVIALAIRRVKAGLDIPDSVIDVLNTFEVNLESLETITVDFSYVLDEFNRSGPLQKAWRSNSLLARDEFVSAYVLASLYALPSPPYDETAMVPLYVRELHEKGSASASQAPIPIPQLINEKGTSLIQHPLWRSVLPEEVDERFDRLLKLHNFSVN